MNNDATLFMRADQVETAWNIIIPIPEGWSGKPQSDFKNYAAGTLGPEAVDKLLFPGHHCPSPADIDDSSPGLRYINSNPNK